jgi:hypothetical protein
MKLPDFHRSISTSAFALYAALTDHNDSNHQPSTCHHTSVTEHADVTFTTIHQRFIILLISFAFTAVSRLLQPCMLKSR